MTSAAVPGPGNEAEPVVWAFCAGKAPWGDQGWYAVSEDGRVIAQHISSSHGWGQRDVSPQRRPDAYQAVLGTVDVDYRVAPEGEYAPEEVLERAGFRRREASGSVPDHTESEGR